MPGTARSTKSQDNQRNFSGSSDRHSGTAKAPPAYGIDLADRDNSPAGAQTSTLYNSIGNAPASPISRIAPAIQTKLTIGESGDKYEKEADEVAEQVMRTPHPTVQRAPLDDDEKPNESIVQAKSLLPPKAGEQKQQMAGEAAASSIVQRDSRETAGDFRLSRSSTASTSATSDSGNMESAASFAVRNKDSGSPISPSIRNRLETGTGTDLGKVRVHSDPVAHSAAQSLGARAFTHRQDIWLGKGESQSDVRLMAHESTHVAQQTNTVQRLDSDTNTDTNTTAPSQSASPLTTTPASTAAPAIPEPAPSRGAAPRVAFQPVAAPPPPSPPAAGTAASSSTTTSSPVASTPESADTPPPAEPVELLMSEPPTGLSSSDRQRIRGVERNAGSAAATQEALPSAGENVTGARQAVQEPAEETAARAEAGLTAALSERPEPSAEIEALCSRIRAAIRARRPPDEDSLLETNPSAEAEAAGGMLESSVEGDVNSVEDSYEQLNETPQGEVQQQAQPLESPPATVPAEDLAASQAVPDAVPAENVSLDADVEASAARMQEAGMESPGAQAVQSGPIADARSAQGELAETAARDPAEVMAEQQAASASAAADMATLQARALETLQSSRADAVDGVGTQQTGMVESEAQMRTRISSEAQSIFQAAQSSVNTLLEPLTRTAMAQWETGVAELSTDFENDLARVKSWLDERYSGAGGALLEVWEGWTGMPDWVTDAYNRAEENFANGVCDLIRSISTDVNSVIATCEEIIDDANTEIAELFTNLPAGLEEWAAGEQARFAEQLNSLHDRVISTRDDFNQDISQRAAQSVQQVRERIHELRVAAGGLIGQIQAAINSFLEDPIRFIIDGLLELVGIPPASFWALINRIQTVISDIADDPMNFANNLASAVGQGFQLFFDNFSTHILGGFFDWLFSGLGAVGVNIPTDFSLPSIITFFLELMGITWDRIRALLARHLGEENVALIEQAYGLIAELIEMGPSGIFEMIKEQLDPRNILDQVLDAAISFLVETLITQVSARIIMMFNPAGAIAQAVELIYRVMSWIFNNAARIFSLVETIVNGAADLIAGNITGMATAVEGALARLIAPVIDFLAGYMGLGDLPDRIADTIRGFQDWIMGILERVVGWLAQRARGLLQSLGIGGDDGQGSGDGDYDAQIGKTVNWTSAGESHRMWIETVRGSPVVMMASGAGDPILEALETYKEKAREIEDEDPETSSEVIELVDRAKTLAEQINAKAEELTDELAEPEPDLDEVSADDDVVESKEDQLRTIMSSIQEKLNLNDEADIQSAKSEFGDRLFSSSELATLLDKSQRTARRRMSSWTAKRILFRLASATTDQSGLSSFDPLKAGQRETNPNNRYKYGYVNPRKDSDTGLTILSKGLRPDSPAPILSRDKAYHRDKARYDSKRPGSTYRDFKYPEAILGHKEEMGASNHWNSEGHMQPRQKNLEWNQKASSYQGPEHYIESRASGGSSERYMVPSKEAGSHESWW